MKTLILFFESLHKSIMNALGKCHYLHIFQLLAGGLLFIAQECDSHLKLFISVRNCLFNLSKKCASFLPVVFLEAVEFHPCVVEFLPHVVCLFCPIPCIPEGEAETKDELKNK